jgi:hypothetical protein
MNMTLQPGQAVTTATTQYVMLAGKTVYVITLTTRDDLAEQYRPIFEEIGQSFRLIQ